MGKRRKHVEFYESWDTPPGAAAWTAFFPWDRHHRKAECAEKREFLRAAAVVAREAERVRKEATSD